MEDERYQRAKQRVDRLKAFYWSLAMFVAVNLFLFAVDVLTDSGWWFYWVTIFWGFGLVVQAVMVFGPFGGVSKNWEDRKVQQYMDEDK